MQLVTRGTTKALAKHPDAKARMGKGENLLYFYSYGSKSLFSKKELDACLFVTNRSLLDCSFQALSSFFVFVFCFFDCCFVFPDANTLF